MLQSFLGPLPLRGRLGGGAVMCGKEPAPHVETSEYMEFRPRAGEEYDFWFRVAEGNSGYTDCEFIASDTARAPSTR